MNDIHPYRTLTYIYSLSLTLFGTFTILDILLFLYWVQGVAWVISAAVTRGGMLCILILLLYRHSQLRDYISKDKLTQAYTRDIFFRALTNLLAAHVDKRDAPPLSLILFDLDDFKQINDDLGHSAGDEVLRDISADTMRSIRRADIFARVGGEEFGIILPNTRVTEAKHLAERVRQSLYDSSFRGGQHTVSATLGVGEWKESDQTLGRFYDRVDSLLYQGKQAGKNIVIAEA